MSSFKTWLGKSPPMLVTAAPILVKCKSTSPFSSPMNQGHARTKSKCSRERGLIWLMGFACGALLSFSRHVTRWPRSDEAVSPLEPSTITTTSPGTPLTTGLPDRPPGPARGQTGHWIGNTWLPPKPWQYYNQQELQHLYGGKNLLWIGDSTARRASMTLFGIMQSALDSNHTSVDLLTDPTMIDLNRGNMTEPCTVSPFLRDAWQARICRRMPSAISHRDTATGIMAFSMLPCFHEVEALFRSLTNNMTTATDTTTAPDVIMLGLGSWEAVASPRCQIDNRTVEQRLATALSLTVEFATSRAIPIVWRTAAYIVETPEAPESLNANQVIRSLNEQLIQQLDQLQPAMVTYLDWAGAVEARTLGLERIPGDVYSHFGLEPRIVLIEMMTNHLLDRGVIGEYEHRKEN